MLGFDLQGRCFARRDVGWHQWNTGWPRFGLVMVHAWDGSNGSGFSVTTVPRQVLSVSILIQLKGTVPVPVSDSNRFPQNGSDGSGSSFGFWKNGSDGSDGSVSDSSSVLGKMESKRLTREAAQSVTSEMRPRWSHVVQCGWNPGSYPNQWHRYFWKVNCGLWMFASRAGDVFVTSELYDVRE